LTYLPINGRALRRAAEFWAQARRQHHPTAGDQALDGDVIIAAQAEQVAATVATDNVRHLALFVPARSWRDLPPR
jgi:predicted nucleic acid-binding protein